MKKALLMLSLMNASLFSMKLEIAEHAQNANKMRIDSSSTFIPKRLGSLDLYHGEKGFYIRKDNQKHPIKKYFTDQILCDMTKKQLKGFLKNGYLAVNQMDDGEYSLKAKGRVNGGGPILGAIAYWVTKSLCYGTIFAGIGATIGAGGKITAGTMSPTAKERSLSAAAEMAAEGVKIGIGCYAATATVPLTSAMVASAGVTSGGITTITISTGAALTSSAAPTLISTAAMGASSYSGAGLASAGITGSGFAPEAALVSMAGATSTVGTNLGVVGSIELLAIKVGLFFGMTPTV